MGLDVGVFDDHYRYLRHLHIGKDIHGLLFKKIVTVKDYPSLGKAQHEEEDITFTPADIPALVADVEKLEKYLKMGAPMSDEVKGRCLDFVAALKELCRAALDIGRNVEFIAGE